jgi:hypothetical protein
VTASAADQNMQIREWRKDELNKALFAVRAGLTVPRTQPDRLISRSL